MGSPGKESACNAGGLGLILGSGRSPGGYSSILAWRIPWTEEPGRLQSMGSQRVRHNWGTKQRATTANTVTESKIVGIAFGLRQWKCIIVSALESKLFWLSLLIDVGLGVHLLGPWLHPRCQRLLIYWVVWVKILYVEHHMCLTSLPDEIALIYHHYSWSIWHLQQPDKQVKWRLVGILITSLWFFVVVLFSIFPPLKGLELLLIYYLDKGVARGSMVPKVVTQSFLPDFPSLH